MKIGEKLKQLLTELARTESNESFHKCARKIGAIVQRTEDGELEIGKVIGSLEPHKVERLALRGLRSITDGVEGRGDEMRRLFQEG